MTRRFWLIVALCAVWLAPLRAADISGKWTASFDTQVGKQNYTYDFKVAGTSLTGRAKSDNGDVEIKEGKVTGDTVTFVENLSFQGMDLKITYTGKIISADEIKFTRDVAGIANEELTAKRAK
jgi:hypothetical protein